jgi:response regulator RpfG family c-di-GMP phosphodiesterase
MFNILIVDDDKNNRFSIGALLDELDVNLYEAQNGESALIQLMENKVDLIILDVQLPDYNGFQLAKMIKTRKSTNEIPIILATAVFKAQVFVEQGFEAGAIDYVLKPINSKILLSKVRYYIKLYEERTELISEKNIYKKLIEKISEKSDAVIRIYEDIECVTYSNESYLDNKDSSILNEKRIKEQVENVIKSGISSIEEMVIENVAVNYEVDVIEDGENRKILFIAKQRF